jgi:hypothetical protein
MVSPASRRLGADHAEYRAKRTWNHWVRSLLLFQIAHGQPVRVAAAPLHRPCRMQLVRLVRLVGVDPERRVGK